MTKLVLTDITDLQNEASAVSKMQTNNAAIVTAVENTLSRDGTTPNTMAASLDMNSNRIINLPDPVGNQEPVTLAFGLANYGNSLVNSNNAAASAAAAATSATNANTSAGNAATSATNASNSASAASTSASNASTSATNAATSAANAAAVSGFRYIWSTNTAATDPGTGTLKVNNATPASATALYISETDVDSNALAALIADWGASTSTNKAVVRISKISSPSTVWAQYYVTAAVTDNGTWDTVTITYKDGQGTFLNLDAVVLSAQLIGDKGNTGATGAVGITGTPTANQFTTWSNATTAQGVSITGIVKGNGASAPTAAVSGTDYAPATTGSAILKGNGSGGFASAAAGTDYQAADPQLSSVVGINSQSAAYTTVLTDGGKAIYHPNTDNTARTFTIPANASVAYPVGTTLTFINGINTVTISIITDTLTLAGTGSTGNRTLAANGIATAIKVSATQWFISGVGLS